MMLVAEGFTREWTKEREGVRDEAGNFYPTVPLNGWRARSLAENVLGVRSAGEWYLGRAVVVSARILKALPGFDRRNQDIVDGFEGNVMIQVVVDDPSYGLHIRIIQA